MCVCVGGGIWDTVSVFSKGHEYLLFVENEGNDYPECRAPCIQQQQFPVDFLNRPINWEIISENVVGTVNDN